MNVLEKVSCDYARERLSYDDYPEYNDEYELKLAFEAGAEWQKQQFRKIENYQEEGWYSSGDDEYIYGIKFDEPIRLPVDFYVKKK